MNLNTSHSYILQYCDELFAPAGAAIMVNNSRFLSIEGPHKKINECVCASSILRFFYFFALIPN